jgi:hypothetical protein
VLVVLELEEELEELEELDELDFAPPEDARK